MCISKMRIPFGNREIYIFGVLTRFFSHNSGFSRELERFFLSITTNFDDFCSQNIFEILAWYVFNSIFSTLKHLLRF